MEIYHIMMDNIRQQSVHNFSASKGSSSAFKGIIASEKIRQNNSFYLTNKLVNIYGLKSGLDPKILPNTFGKFPKSGVQLVKMPTRNKFNEVRT